MFSAPISDLHTNTEQKEKATNNVTSMDHANETTDEDGDAVMSMNSGGDDGEIEDDKSEKLHRNTCPTDENKRSGGGGSNKNDDESVPMSNGDSHEKADVDGADTGESSDDQGNREKNKEKLNTSNGDVAAAKGGHKDGTLSSITHGETKKERENAAKTKSASEEKGEIKSEESETQKMNGSTNTNKSTDSVTKNNINGSASASASASTSATVADPALPLLKGKLYYISNELTRKHVIQGMWNFESSTENAPQRFELVRQLGPDEDPADLLKDGTFNGSFNLAYVHISAKGKRKERTRVIAESGVKIKFVKKEDCGDADAYDVKGQGTNQYGVFSIFGSAARDWDEKDKNYKVELRKRYLTSPAATAPVVSSDSASPGKKVKNKSKKRKLGNANPDNIVAQAPVPTEPLPEASEPIPSGVVCLRGKIARDSSAQDGVVHNVSGMWSSGLDVIESDPDNNRGLCNRFEYEYRGTVATEAFPISGKYTGWFNLTTEDGTRTRIPERDVTLKFKKNNAGHYNVEGRGSNLFGKYNITGSLDSENQITIFRHFLPVKAKPKKTPAPAPAAVEPIEDKDAPPRMTLDDVKVPEGDTFKALEPPNDGSYAAVSRGVIRVNDDGGHTCSGKWAITRSHYNSNMASNFHFGLEGHHAKLSDENGGAEEGEIPFPVDSANYKGSFKMKRGTAKLHSVVDNQIVMKFRKNSSGSFNVYGKGVNSIGAFDLVGTLILHGRGSGHVELYRMYQLPPPGSEPAPKTQQQTQRAKALPTAKSAVSKKKSTGTKSPSTVSSFTASTAIRRESSRQPKLPSRLQEGDPQALKSRIIEKCAAVLKAVREKDIVGGSFFAEPVDPVAHKIPQYHQIITDPMDLGTIQYKMDHNEIETPEEFSRLVRLVFQNAIKFNEDQTHVVHQTARNLLTLFNNRFKDVERMIEKKKPTKKELKEIKKKEQEEHKRLEKERKRKREEDEDPKLRHLRLMKTSSEEVSQSLKSLNSIVTPGSAQSTGTVTRNEFIALTNMIRGMYTQMSHMQTLITSLVTPNNAQLSGSSVAQYSVTALPAPTTEASSKKAKRKKLTKVEKPVLPERFVPAPVPAPAPTPVPAPRKVVKDVPLTLEEQQELTEAINTMSPENLEGVIEIIRESADLNEEEDEIDLEIDQLKVSTQRKLMNFVLKNKPKPKKTAKKNTKRRSPAPAPTPAPKPKAPAFSAFGSHGNDSDSDSEASLPMEKEASDKVSNGFQINPDTTMEDDDDDAMDGGGLANWNITKPEADDEDDSDDEDDAWNAAHGAASQQQALEKERQAREEKMIADAEEAKEKSLAEAAERGKKLQDERKAKELEAARIKEQKAKDDRDKALKARAKALEDLKNVAPVVDMESQRNIMNEYEEAFNFQDDGMSGGASPSSDFGF